MGFDTIEINLVNLYDWTPIVRMIGYFVFLQGKHDKLIITLKTKVDSLVEKGTKKCCDISPSPMRSISG